MEIKTISFWGNLWNNLVDYTNSCDREAWPILAEKMQWNDFSDWEKVFVATENDRIIWFCTFTKEDWTPLLAVLVFVDKNYQWKRISEKNKCSRKIMHKGFEF